ncbi:Arm DNA-binding domain-containing protein [Planctobacterium marinum]|uniref:Arm DNA-binding domain-containing protein n=1 Tax=Planctobacterium marinum TaxID=1631968 RepID=UPI003616A24E|nr:Arm DNA-binding domain-containing protein [Planctobacterium marinum]
MRWKRFVAPKRGQPYWSLRYSLNGKRREKSIGKALQLSLAEARGLAEQERSKLREGLDPLTKFADSILSIDELFNDYFQNKLLRLVYYLILGCTEKCMNNNLMGRKNV